MQADLQARSSYKVMVSGGNVGTSDMQSSKTTRIVVTSVDCVGGGDVTLTPSVGDAFVCQAGSNPFVLLPLAVTCTAGGNITIGFYEWDM